MSVARTAADKSILGLRMVCRWDAMNLPAHAATRKKEVRKNAKQEGAHAICELPIKQQTHEHNDSVDGAPAE